MSRAEEEDLAALIELAGLKRNRGISALARLQGLPGSEQWLSLVAEAAKLRTAVNGQAHPFLSPDAEDLPAGGLVLGRLVLMDGTDGGDVHLPLDALLEHMYVAGTTGSSKSWFLMFIVSQLVDMGYRALVLDSEGDFAAILGSLFPHDRLRILDVNSFRRNFHQPVLAETPLQTIARIKALLRSQWLRDGSINLAGEVFASEYENGRWPTARSILSKLERMRFRAGRMAEYLESLTNRYRALVDYAPAYDCYEGADLGVLLERSTCLVMRGLSLEVQDFVVQELLASLASYLEQTAPAGLALAIVLDEIHRFASRERLARTDIGEGLLFDVFRSIRKRGGAIISADQLPGQTAPQVLGLSNTKVIFRLADGTGAKAIGDALP